MIMSQSQQQQLQQMASQQSFRQHQLDEPADRLRAQSASAPLHQPAQGQQPQSLMMTSASNLDSTGSSSAPDLITQGSAPSGSSSSALKQTSSDQAPDDQPNHFNHQPSNHQNVENLPKFAGQTTSALEGMKLTSYNPSNHQQFAAHSSSSQQPQMTLGPFQYQQQQQPSSSSSSSSSALAHSKPAGSGSLFTPRHMLIMNQGTSSLDMSPSSAIYSFSSPMDQMAASDSQQQQQYMGYQAALSSQRPQQTFGQPNGQQQSTTGGQGKSALLNQLTRLWSIVGRQKSLLPSISPFSPKAVNQRQLQESISSSNLNQVQT